MKSDLQYDEFKHVGTDYGSIDEVAEYDRRMQKLRNIAQESAAILDVLNITPDSAVLEFGTGTGEFAIAAAKRCSKVYAIDVSPAMLGYAKRKASDKGLANMEFIHAGFLSYEHQGAPVNAVVTQLALHHLPDFWKMIALRRISDMLAPGGRLYLKDVVFPGIAAEDYVAHFAPFVKGVESGSGEEIAKEIKLHIKEEFSTFDWILEEMLKRSGLTILNTSYENGFFATYLCEKA